MITKKIREFYSDGKVHTNAEAYEYLDAQTEEEQHTVRGIQQALKKQDWLINVGRGSWMINPQRVLHVEL